MIEVSLEPWDRHFSRQLIYWVNLLFKYMVGLVPFAKSMIVKLTKPFLIYIWASYLTYVARCIHTESSTDRTVCEANCTNIRALGFAGQRSFTELLSDGLLCLLVAEFCQRLCIWSRNYTGPWSKWCCVWNAWYSESNWTLFTCGFGCLRIVTWHQNIDLLSPMATFGAVSIWSYSRPEPHYDYVRYTISPSHTVITTFVC